MDPYTNRQPFAVLVGKTLAAIREDRESVVFVCDDGSEYRMEHFQDCCESVSIEDRCGEWSDLIGTPILFAEESTSDEDPVDYKPESDYRESYTWTFYRIGTVRGTVVLRWLGESNGYYSESVEFWQSEAPRAVDAVARCSGVSTDSPRAPEKL